MADFDILADTVLQDEAVRALEYFASQHSCVVRRSQISGLRQIAANEPDKLLGFADTQRERAQKRLERASNPKREAEVAFWDLVKQLCGADTRGNSEGWSLKQLAETLAPPDCRVGKKPHGSAPAVEHAAHREAKGRAEEWKRRRTVEDTPVYFQHFCAHYLYLIRDKEDHEL